MKISGAVLEEYNKPIVVEELELSSPEPDEVCVKYAAAGICFSDLSRSKGKYPSSLPLVLGHEGAGEVVSVGEAVTDLKPGDHVALSVQYSCGKCFYCSKGEWQLCTVSNDLIRKGTMPDGTTRLRRKNGEKAYHHVLSSYATHGVLPANNAIKIPKEMDLVTATLVSCGVLTGVGAVFNKAKVTPGSTCIVFGAGGVGLNAVQGCALSGARTVIVADISDEKLELAKTFGATHVVNANQQDPVEFARSLTGGHGVDFAFEAVGVPAIMMQAYESTRRGGCCTIVGIASSDAQLKLAPFGLMWDDKVLQGAFAPYYARRDVPIICDLFMSGRFKLTELVNRHYRLDEVNQAFDDLENGRLSKGLILHD